LVRRRVERRRKATRRIKLGGKKDEDGVEAADDREPTTFGFGGEDGFRVFENRLAANPSELPQLHLS